tara:strand:- start:809 stop:994 length:186 start_codon:yes stop_codon:yes gene_type:complete
MNSNRNNPDIKQVDEAVPDESFTNLKRDVDRGYKKFLEKRNLQAREPFAYGKNLERVDRED